MWLLWGQSMRSLQLGRGHEAHGVKTVHMVSVAEGLLCGLFPARAVLGCDTEPHYDPYCSRLTATECLGQQRAHAQCAVAIARASMPSNWPACHATES